MSDESVNLTAEEARCLALRLAARQVASEWLEWEDVPYLGELAFKRLEDAVGAVAEGLYRHSQATEHAYNVDAAELLERIEA